MRRIKPTVIDDLVFCAKDLGFDVESIKTAEMEYGLPTVVLRLQAYKGSSALRDSLSVAEPELFSEPDPDTVVPVPENAKMQTLDEDAITQ